jgi:hypothetical protein
MGKNALLEQYAEREIARRIAKGELFTLDMVNKDLMANCEMLAKMMTIAVNRGAGIGKKRFNERVQPVLDELLDEWFENKRTADQEYAISVVERMYNQIMEE